MSLRLPGRIGRSAAPQGARVGEPVADSEAPSLVAFDETARQLVSEHLMLGRRGLAVAGVNAGTGASYVTARLGMALARAGVNTLLVDTDLGSAGLRAQLPADGDLPGLADLLLDPALAVMDCLAPQAQPNLSVLHAGRPAEGMGELLHNPRFRSVVEQLLRMFGCVLFDTPPANRSPDGRWVSAAVGYAVIVARRSQTFVDDVEHLAKVMNDDGVLVVGAILNGA